MVRFTLVLVVLNAAWTLSRADTVVSCQFNETCILPCSFRFADEVLIHWYQKKPANLRVHSYYYNKDQLGEQDQRFRGRTSLFKDQISRGNSSLLLRGVKVQDQGRYLCYTSTVAGNEEHFINLNVNAPVKKVNIEQRENQIICSSEGIYPKPGLTWTTSPPSSRNLQKEPTVQQTEQQLYNINSSLVLSDNDTDLDYICTVSTAANKRRSTLMKPAVINSSDSEATISCWTSETPLTYLTWRFNHSQIILTQSRTEDTYKPSERWKQHVISVSETGSLMLKDLSSDQTGTYTCELSNNEETYVKDTFLHITEAAKNAGVIVIVVPVVLGIVVTVAVVALGYRFHKKRSKKSRSHADNSTVSDKSNGGSEMISEISEMILKKDPETVTSCQN